MIPARLITRARPVGEAVLRSKPGYLDIEALLPPLHSVRRTGERKYLARCPAHPARNLSLSVKAKVSEMN